MHESLEHSLCSIKVSIIVTLIKTQLLLLITQDRVSCRINLFSGWGVEWNLSMIFSIKTLVNKSESSKNLILLYKFPGFKRDH